MNRFQEPRYRDIPDGVPGKIEIDELEFGKSGISFTDMRAELVSDNDGWIVEELYIGGIEVAGNPAWLGITNLAQYYVDTNPALVDWDEEQS